jgi:hypothetical protein
MTGGPMEQHYYSTRQWKRQKRLSTGSCRTVNVLSRSLGDLFVCTLEYPTPGWRNEEEEMNEIPENSVGFEECFTGFYSIYRIASDVHLSLLFILGIELISPHASHKSRLAPLLPQPLHKGFNLY